jgi:hypothetical protein
MVGYIKQHFFVRYRAFDSWAHLNQLAEYWLHAEADKREHGTVHEVIADRFAQEQPVLHALPTVRYDTAYLETRQVSGDCYIDVRGNRYSVPDNLAGQLVTVRIGLDEQLRVYAHDQLVAQHHLQPRSQGWVSVPAHHAHLWQDAWQVEQRPLDVYQEVATWRS